MSEITNPNLPGSPEKLNLSRSTQKPDRADGSMNPGTTGIPDRGSSPQKPNVLDPSESPKATRRATDPHHRGFPGKPNFRASTRYPGLSRLSLKPRMTGSLPKSNLPGSKTMPNLLDPKQHPDLPGPQKEPATPNAPQQRNLPALPRQPPRHLPKYTRTRNPTPPGLARKYPSEWTHGPAPMAAKEKEVARQVDALETAIESFALKVQWLGTWWLDQPESRVGVLFPVAGDKVSFACASYWVSLMWVAYANDGVSARCSREHQASQVVR
jgi:hypothetical protein